VIVYQVAGASSPVTSWAPRRGELSVGHTLQTAHASAAVSA
jgi:hypothetical protein